MNFHKIKSYHLFWIVSVLIVIIGILQNNNPQATLDINIHDTYFVFRNYDATIILFICYFLMGTGYWLIQKLFKRPLVRFLTVIHSAILIGSFIIYWIVFFYNKRSVETAFPLYDNYWAVNTVLIIELLLITFIATPVYIINLIIGICRKSKIR